MGTGEETRKITRLENNEKKKPIRKKDGKVETNDYHAKDQKIQSSQCDEIWQNGQKIQGVNISPWILRFMRYQVTQDNPMSQQAGKQMQWNGE